MSGFQKWCAEILPIVQAGVEGKVVECYIPTLGWTAGFGLHFYGASKYRIKPETMMVNGFEVPKSISRLPRSGSLYCVSTTSPALFSQLVRWDCGDPYIHQLLSRGLLHTNEEAVVAHAKAICGIDPKWEG